jgi:uncharacterized membrane protein SpoIIM required for sporulation
VDIDRFIAQHQTEWARLDQLSGLTERRQRNLSADETAELVTLYERVSTHLADASHRFPEPSLHRRLTTSVAAAHSKIYGRRRFSIRPVVSFFSSTFPGAVWASRRFILVATALLFVPAIAMGAWLANSESALDAEIPPEAREIAIEEEFEQYYSSEPAGQFATTVFVNNVRVAILAFGAGIFFCIGAAWVLIENGLLLGRWAGVFLFAGQGDRFFGLILPHGLLELTAVVIAGGAGLRLGWSIISPGDRTRGAALADEGRRSVTIVLGLVVVFGVAAVIEAFVTPSPLDTAARVGVGVVVWLAFLVYIVSTGPAAVARGDVGRLGVPKARWDDEPLPAAEFPDPAAATPDPTSLRVT